MESNEPTSIHVYARVRPPNTNAEGTTPTSAIRIDGLRSVTVNSPTTGTLHFPFHKVFDQLSTQVIVAVVDVFPR